MAAVTSRHLTQTDTNSCTDHTQRGDKRGADTCCIVYASCRVCVFPTYCESNGTKALKQSAPSPRPTCIRPLPILSYGEAVLGLHF